MRFAPFAALVMLTAVVAVLVVDRPATAHGSSSPTGRVITVTGTGTASAVPDVASFSFGVQTDGATAREAQAANADRMSAVIAALGGLGIAKADLQTTDVSVSPKWSNEGAVTGYTAHSSLQAKVHRVARAGRIVDAAVGAGATESSGPTFSRSGTALYESALQNAVVQARAKAEALAAEADVQLGAATRIEEQAPQPRPEIGFYRGALARTPTPIEPGTQKTEATVTVTFALA